MLVLMRQSILVTGGDFACRNVSDSNTDLWSIYPLTDRLIGVRRDDDVFGFDHDPSLR